MRILFVCTGNICRSPTAEGIARHKLREEGLDATVSVDSAGTHDYHAGEGPDPRARKAAQSRGYDLSGQRAREVTTSDFQRFDLVLAMDRGHYQELKRRCPRDQGDRVKLFTSFVPGNVRDVPDPFYGSPRGFEEVLDLVETGVDGLIAHLRQNYTG